MNNNNNNNVIIWWAHSCRCAGGESSRYHLTQYIYGQGNPMPASSRLRHPPQMVPVLVILCIIDTYAVISRCVVRVGGDTTTGGWISGSVNINSVVRESATVGSSLVGGRIEKACRRRRGSDAFGTGRCGPTVVSILCQESSGNVGWLRRWSIRTSGWPYHHFHNKSFPLHLFPAPCYTRALPLSSCSTTARPIIISLSPLSPPSLSLSLSLSISTYIYIQYLYTRDGYNSSCC